MRTILVTGGAGYIGSHTTVELIEAGYDVVVVDNLSNSKYEAVKRVEKIVNRSVKFYEADICNKDAMRKIFAENKFDAVINFAGYKAVGESVSKPLEYYENNIYGMIALLDVMREYKVKNLVFSSSATVYGNPHTVPITEDFPLSTTNPYGSTKLFIEYILKDLAKADKEFNIAILRYFNPVGAHPCGLIGEDPNGIPNNLCPYITKVAAGKLEKVNVFGDDYDTPDGSCIRDYIHILDLAQAHEKALYAPESGCYNLGTGNGLSVKEIISAAEEVTGKKVNFEVAPRRAGDPPRLIACSELARKKLNWQPRHESAHDIIESAWKWHLKFPDGYEK